VIFNPVIVALATVTPIAKLYIGFDVVPCWILPAAIVLDDKTIVGVGGVDTMKL
jgi:hypothetical protein